MSFGSVFSFLFPYEETNPALVELLFSVLLCHFSYKKSNKGEERKGSEKLSFDFRTFKWYRCGFNNSSAMFSSGQRGTDAALELLTEWKIKKSMLWAATNKLLSRLTGLVIISQRAAQHRAAIITVLSHSAQPQVKGQVLVHATSSDPMKERCTVGSVIPARAGTCTCTKMKENHHVYPLQ